MEKSTPYRNAWYRDLLEKEKELKEYTDEKISNVDLSELKDVSIIDVGDGQTLVYDAETEKWKNAETKQNVIVIPVHLNQNHSSVSLLNGMKQKDLYDICRQNKDKAIFLVSNETGYTYYTTLFKITNGSTNSEPTFLGLVYRKNYGVSFNYFRVTQSTQDFIPRDSEVIYLAPTTADNGKLLGVANGYYAFVDPPSNDVVFEITYEPIDRYTGKIYLGKGTTTLLYDTSQSSHPVTRYLEDLGNDISAGKNIRLKVWSPDGNHYYTIPTVSAHEYYSPDGTVVMLNRYTIITTKNYDDPNGVSIGFRLGWNILNGYDFVGEP